MKIKIAIIMILPALVLSQGQFLEKGQNGFGIRAGFGTNEDMNLLGIDVGYSFNGIIDFGIGYTKGTTKDEPKLSVNMIHPLVSFYLLKQNDNMPLSFSAGVGYQKGFYSSDYYDSRDIDVSSSGFLLDGDIFTVVELGDFSIIPTISIGYESTTRKVKYSGNTNKEDETSTSIDFTVPIVFNVSSNKFSFAPGISIDDENTTFIMALILIIPNW